MKHKFDDEINYGLGRPKLSLDKLFMDDPGSARKYSKNITVALSAEMYQALQEVVHVPSLYFQGNLSALVRHAIGVTLESLEEFMQEDSRTLYRAFMRQQRRLSRERIILTVEELIDQQVEALQFWTAKGKWAMVSKDLNHFLAEVEDYPEPEWQEHAARVWLSHDGVRALLKTWQMTMQDENVREWRNVRKATDRLEAMVQ